jgi:sulfide:quinone oxidoreductase
MKKVLVLGGGFAGLESAIQFRKNGFEVSLVSNREYFYNYPVSIWVPFGGKKFEDICYPLDRFAKRHRFQLIMAEVKEIRSRENKVILGKSELEYDYCVVALGAGKMPHLGSEQFLSICRKPEEATEIQKKLAALVEKGKGNVAIGFGGNPKDLASVRGGPAFEVTFNLHNYLKKEKIRNNFQITFFAPMDKPGAKLGEKALKMIGIFFDKYGIHRHFGKKIVEFVPDGVLFEDQSKLVSDLTIFIPASSGHPALKNSDLPLTDAGFVEIEPTCQVKGMENVYAVGDVANLAGPDWRAKQGHIAEMMAKFAAFNVLQKEKGKSKRKSYLDHIKIICLMDSGDGAALVKRDSRKSSVIPLPIIGHWLKKAWAVYWRLSKLGRIPRLPGM